MPDRIKQGKPESSYDDHLDENFSCGESFFETTINCDPLAVSLLTVPIFLLFLTF